MFKIITKTRKIPALWPFENITDSGIIKFWAERTHEIDLFQRTKVLRKIKCMTSACDQSDDLIIYFIAVNNVVWQCLFPLNE
jgi:hypothetical protein